MTRPPATSATPAVIRTLLANPRGLLMVAPESPYEPSDPQRPSRFGTLLLLHNPAEPAQEYHFHLTRHGWTLHKILDPADSPRTETTVNSFHVRDSPWRADPDTDAALTDLLAAYLTAVDEREQRFAELVGHGTNPHWERATLLDHAGRTWSGTNLVLQTPRGQAVFTVAHAGMWMLASLGDVAAERHPFDPPAHIPLPAVTSTHTRQALSLLLIRARIG